MHNAEPPQGVRIVDRITGREMPVELRDIGYDEDGMHIWVVVSEVQFDPARHSLNIAVLPPRTGIQFQVRKP